MKIWMQYWVQPRNKNKLILVSPDRAGLRLARHHLLFAGDGVKPGGEAFEAVLEDYAPAARRLVESPYVFISNVELFLYVTILRPP